jgi:GNAT superfamily N-acetyltransferase
VTDIRRLGPGDEDALVAASDLFDHPVTTDRARGFLAGAGSAVFLAYDGDDPIGFLTAFEHVLPDQAPELYLSEMYVLEDRQRRGIGTALVERFRDLARERGCSALWVLTEEDNDAALGLYGSVGAPTRTTQAMFEWDDR